MCGEAGRSLRTLSRRYSKVLVAALTYQTDAVDDEDAPASEEDGME